MSVLIQHNRSSEGDCGGSVTERFEARKGTPSKRPRPGTDFPTWQTHCLERAALRVRLTLFLYLFVSRFQLNNFEKESKPANHLNGYELLLLRIRCSPTLETAAEAAYRSGRNAVSWAWVRMPATLNIRRLNRVGLCFSAQPGESFQSLDFLPDQY